MPLSQPVVEGMMWWGCRSQDASRVVGADVWMATGAEGCLLLMWRPAVTRLQLEVMEEPSVTRPSSSCGKVERKAEVLLDEAGCSG